tara:strand:+ start:385 stop:489 length:105 start_codon:yes stop_codon:yes gene_type:complete
MEKARQLILENDPEIKNKIKDLVAKQFLDLAGTN